MLDDVFIYDQFGKKHEWKAVHRKLQATAEEKKKNRIIPRDCYDKPQDIQVELTGSCNLNCEFCYNDSKFGKIHELSDDTILSLCNDLIKLDAFRLNLTGGEIFLRKDLLYKVIDIFSKSQMNIVLLTNGTLLTDEDYMRLSSYKACIEMIQVSIDSQLDTIHDRMRGKIGCWEKAVRSVKRLSDLGFWVRISSVVTKENNIDFEEMINLAIFLRAKSICFGLVINSGRAENTHQFFSQKEANTIYDEIAELRQRYKTIIRVEQSSSVSVAFQYSFLEPQKGFVILPNGDVKTDCLLDIVLGNITDSPIEEIWDKKVKMIHSDSLMLKNYLERADKVDMRYNNESNK